MGNSIYCSIDITDNHQYFTTMYKYNQELFVLLTYPSKTLNMLKNHGQSDHVMYILHQYFRCDLELNWLHLVCLGIWKHPIFRLNYLKKPRCDHNCRNTNHKCRKKHKSCNCNHNCRNLITHKFSTFHKVVFCPWTFHNNIYFSHIIGILKANRAIYSARPIASSQSLLFLRQRETFQI